MSAFIVQLHNAWLTIPEGIRAALSFCAATVAAEAVALIENYGWFVPSDVNAAKGEALAFLAYAVPVLAVLVAQLVRSTIAPAVVNWFLSTFGYKTEGFGFAGKPADWVKAA
jgi:hypothetical protein